MIKKLSELKPNPINDDIYSTTDLTELKTSIDSYGLLEPICVNQQNTIISGHRRYYAMLQLGIKECEVSVNQYENDIIGLIEHNRARQKTHSDILNEIETLKREYKKEIGQGKRTDLTGGDKLSTDKKLAHFYKGTIGLSSMKQISTINNYEPNWVAEKIDGEGLSISAVYKMVQDKHLHKDKPKNTEAEFKRSFRQLLKRYEPPLELIQSVVDGVYPYSRDKAVKEENTKDKGASKFDTKREELINHLEFLRKMDTNQQLLYKKEKEIQLFNFKKPLKDKVRSNIWKPKDISNIMDTIEEIDSIEPIFEFVEKSSDEFNCLRVNIHSMEYIVNPGRHIRVIVKDKKSKRYLGCLTFGSDFANLESRDEYIGWSDADKFEKGKLKHTMVCSSIVPVQPFGFNFLGGKLLASLTTVKEIRDYWEEKYGDILIGNTTTSVYGSYSMYNSIPYWKKLDKTKGKFLLLPTIEHYQFWLDFVKENYRKEYDKAVSRTSPKQHVQNLIYRILGIESKRYENEHLRGVYFSLFYKNGREFLRNEIDEDCLVLNGLHEKDTDGILAWWKKKAINRYTKLNKEGNISDREYWFDDTKSSDIKSYLATKGLYEE